MAFQIPLMKFGGASYLSRDSDFVDNIDTKRGLASFWFSTAGTSEMAIYRNALAIGFTIVITAAGVVQVQGRETAGGAINLNMTSAAGFNDNALHHCAAAWDLAAGTAQIYIDDASALSGTPTIVDTPISYTNTEHFIAAAGAGISVFDGLFGGLYLNFQATLDLSVEANRRKIIDGSLNPIDPGPNGALVTGNRPILAMHGDLAAWQDGENKGYGGDSSLTGPLQSFIVWPPELDPDSGIVIGRELTTALIQPEKTSTVVEVS